MRRKQRQRRQIFIVVFLCTVAGIALFRNSDDFVSARGKSDVPHGSSRTRAQIIEESTASDPTRAQIIEDSKPMDTPNVPQDVRSITNIPEMRSSAQIIENSKAAPSGTPGEQAAQIDSATQENPPTASEAQMILSTASGKGPANGIGETGTTLDSVQKLYVEYAVDLIQMKHKLMVWANETDLHQGIGDYIAEILYMRIRKLRPDAVAELGFGQGLGTAYILQALEDNGHGHLYSYDIIDKFNRAPKMHLQHRWTFILGDARKHLDKHGPYGYVHSDCEHSTDFARYIANWLRQHRQRRKPGERPILFSFDDVYKWKPGTREWKCVGGTMNVDENGVTPEGRIILNLAKEISSSPKGQVFGIACSHFPDIYKKLKQIRYSIGLDDNLVSDRRKYKDPDGWKKGNKNKKL